MCTVSTSMAFRSFDFKPTYRFDRSWFSDPVIVGRDRRTRLKVHTRWQAYKHNSIAVVGKTNPVRFCAVSYGIRGRRRRFSTRLRHVGTSKNRFRDQTRFVKNRLRANRLFPLVCRKSKSTRNRRSENRRNGLTIPPTRVVLFIPYGPHVLTSLIAKHHNKRTSCSTWRVFSKIC